MFLSANLGDAMRGVCSILQRPVIFILLVLIACTILLLGSLVAEFFIERRHVKVQMTALVDKLYDKENKLDECIQNSGLLKRQKAVLMELEQRSDFTDLTRDALAVRLLAEERARYKRIITCSEIIVRLGPIFGLMGTLIPLGPGIIALGRGDTYTLSLALLTAFDTTTLGLASAAGCSVISTIRKGWYADYMSILETLMECVLEAKEKHDWQTQVRKIK
jgi:biopolymer transport protein ExbB/TolQ